MAKTKILGDEYAIVTGRGLGTTSGAKTVLIDFKPGDESRMVKAAMLILKAVMEEKGLRIVAEVTRVKTRGANVGRVRLMFRTIIPE